MFHVFVQSDMYSVGPVLVGRGPTLALLVGLEITSIPRFVLLQDSSSPIRLLHCIYFTSESGAWVALQPVSFSQQLAKVSSEGASLRHFGFCTSLVVYKRKTILKS